MPNSATNMSRTSSGSTSHSRSMPSLTRKPTPNNDSTTPTFTGTLPVVNQRQTFASSASNADGWSGRRGAARLAGAATAGAAGAGATRGSSTAGCGAGVAAVLASGAGSADRTTGAGGATACATRAGGGASAAGAGASDVLRASSRRSSMRTRPAEIRDPTREPADDGAEHEAAEVAEKRAADDTAEQRQDDHGHVTTPYKCAPNARSGQQGRRTGRAPAAASRPANAR